MGRPKAEREPERRGSPHETLVRVGCKRRLAAALDAVKGHATAAAKDGYARSAVSWVSELRQRLQQTRVASGGEADRPTGGERDWLQKIGFAVRGCRVPFPPKTAGGDAVRKLGIVWGAVALSLLAVPGPVQSATTKKCYNQGPVDWWGTDGNDTLYRDQIVDHNGDGRFIAVGGKGDDDFNLDQASYMFTGSHGRPNPPLDPAIHSYLACGWAGNDRFHGPWNYIDGGSGNDFAQLRWCAFPQAWRNGVTSTKMEHVSVFNPDPRMC